MKKRALITGITGMVGSHLLDYLLENTDWEVWGMLRWRSPLDNLGHHIERMNRGDRIKLVYADLRDTMSMTHAVKASRPDYVFHLAAQSYPRTSFDSRSTPSIPTSRVPSVCWAPCARMQKTR